MEGVVLVQGGLAQNVPNYPVDATGKRIFKLPVYHFTPDGQIEVGLIWDPNVLLTGKEISFFVSFFDRANNKPNLLYNIWCYLLYSCCYSSDLLSISEGYNLT
jgi:hypothetical protein